jgi:hypothetical protein
MTWEACKPSAVWMRNGTFVTFAVKQTGKLESALSNGERT